jgi:hypothetical protein
VLAGVACVVFFGAAGLLLFLATPEDASDWTRIDQHISCDAGWIGVVLIGGLFVGAAGLGLVVAGVGRSRRDQTRAGSVVSVSGFAIMAFAAAAIYLGSQASYAASCD